jgi:hypothetical protein
MEAISEGEQVLVRTFSLGGCPIIILFDSSAIHDFINKAYTQKYELPIAHTHTPYKIDTPGGDIITKQVVLSIPLSLAGRVYKTSLIVLDGQGVVLDRRVFRFRKNVLFSIFRLKLCNRIRNSICNKV